MGIQSEIDENERDEMDEDDEIYENEEIEVSHQVVQSTSRETLHLSPSFQPSSPGRKPEGENEENPVRCQSEAQQSEVQQQLPAEFWQQQLHMQRQYDALKEDNKVRHEKMTEDDQPETLRSGGG